MSEDQRRPRVVYFIDARGISRIKIGLARDAAQRLRDMQTGSPTPLVLAATLESNSASGSEAWLHRTFAAERLHGEWFVYTPRLRRLVRALSGWPMSLIHPNGVGVLPPSLWTPAVDDRDPALASKYAYAAGLALFT